VHYSERWRQAEIDKLQLVIEAQRAQLHGLMAQLHPHFLFNSLNSIASLAGSNPTAARAMCEGLGDFLRRTLSLANRERVPLAEEVALVERYLAIEQVRFGERLGVETRVAPDAARCLVPPLLLQPLVENAVKHGKTERPLHLIVRARVRRGTLRLTVRDDDSPKPRGEGHGLDNVRRRLDALASRDAGLEVTSEPGRFRVELTLPAVEANGAEGGRA